MTGLPAATRERIRNGLLAETGTALEHSAS